MSYKYVEFDDVPLPEFNPVQAHGAMPAGATLTRSVGGGIYDSMSDRRALAQPYIIDANGFYVGEESYFTDDGTDDGGDDALIWGDEATMLRAQVTGLLNKRGQRGRLWRERMNDGALEWKQARLLEVRWPRRWSESDSVADLSLRFETAMEGWRAEIQTTHSKALAADGFTYAWVIGVDTELTIDDAVLTITRGSGSITSVYITCVGLGIDLEFTGLATSSGALIIDCGAQTMRHSNGTDLYNFFAFGAGHAARGLVSLAGGNHQFDVTVNGGTATMTIAYYSQTA